MSAGGPEPGVVQRGPHLLQRGGRSVLPVGAHFVPSEGPDWPWRVDAGAFERAFADMAAIGLDSARIDLLWEAIEPEPGRFDQEHLAVLDEVVAAARRHGILLHPTLFIGGEVGDAFWDVPWRDGRHPHGDPEMRALQAAHARMLAERWRGNPAVLAWDLTDEPPFWLFRDTTDEDARAWTREMVDAIRDGDPAHLITIGTSGQETGHGPFRADVVGDLLDFACVHPYPIYAPEVYPDGLLAPRVTLAAAFETALAAGAGRPVMVHEYGASSAQFDPERIAAHDRLMAWSSLGRGAMGFFAWCWTDAEPAAYRRAPYVRQPHETQFGVTDQEGNLRPRGRVLSDLASVVRRIDLDAHAARGPQASAAIVVPHEFSRPYDPAAYGLDGSPAGTYRPAETAWSPERDVAPLVRGWLNAFVLSARAGVSVAFPRESLDDAWPDVRLLLLPAPLASTSSTLLHVRTSFWRGADRYFERGGTLYVSCSADVAIPEMDALGGCRIADRGPAGARMLRFVRPWGPFEPGTELRLPAGDGSLETRGVRLAVSDADVVAVDQDDDPMLVIARRGSGHAVTLAAPAELLLAGVPDAHGPADASWGLYAGLVELSGARDLAWAEHPDVSSGTLLGHGGGLVTVANHGSSHLDVAVHLPEDAVAASVVDARAGGLESGMPERVHLEPYGATIVTWESDRPAT